MFDCIFWLKRAISKQFDRAGKTSDSRRLKSSLRLTCPDDGEVGEETAGEDATHLPW